MARKLIIPGQPSPQDRLTIYVPRGAERRKTGECYLCGAEFAPGDDVVAHMRSCVNGAGEDVRAERYDKVSRLEIFLDPNAWDPEVDEHLRRVGRRMLAEGRMELKPSERAGFS